MPKISQLEEATDVTQYDLIQIVDVEDEGMAISGTNKKVSAQLMANELGKLTNITATGSNTARSLANRFADVVNVKDFGAKGDGVTDDTAAIQAAINSNRRVVVPLGTYRTTSTLNITNSTQQLLGYGNQCFIYVDHTTGPGISISTDYVTISGMSVIASPTRQAFTTGTTYQLASNCYGIQIYRSSGFLTRLYMDKVTVSGHPNHGIYLGGEAADTIFQQVASLANRGHGFKFDARTELSGTKSRCGIVSLINCRALDNGGNAINMDDPTGPTYRFWIYNFETIWNSWNTSISGLENAEMHIGGENHTFQQCALSDQNGDSRITAINGTSRLAKTTLSKGIHIGSNSNYIELNNLRFISTSGGVTTDSSVSALSLVVNGAYFTQQSLTSGNFNQDYGFDIGTGYDLLDIKVPPSSAVNYMVISDDTGGYARIGNDHGRVMGNNVGTVFNLTSMKSAAISSSSVNAQSAYINLTTNSATNLVAIVYAGGSNPLPPNQVIYFRNTSAYDITLKNGTLDGYIRTKTGSDVIIAPGKMFSIITDSSGNPFEL